MTMKRSLLVLLALSSTMLALDYSNDVDDGDLSPEVEATSEASTDAQSASEDGSEAEPSQVYVDEQATSSSSEVSLDEDASVQETAAQETPQPSGGTAVAGGGASSLSQTLHASVRHGSRTLLSKRALLNRASSNSTEYSPPPGLCVVRTGRGCKTYNHGTVVDLLHQCHTEEVTILGNGAAAPRYNTMASSAECSDGSDGHPAGTCVCRKGYCATEDMKCRPGMYELLPETYTLTTKIYGLSQQLYMSGDGEVKVGTPPTPEAGRWRISKTQRGLKQLFTEAYRDHVMQEYELCTEQVNEAGFVSRKCGNIAGHVKNPDASQTGWRLEMHSVLEEQTGFEKEHYLQLRSAYTGNFVFINPSIGDAQTCEPGAQGCPGDYGAIRFQPYPPHEFIDKPMGIQTSIYAYCFTWGLAFILVMAVWFLYSTLDDKGTRYDNKLCYDLCITPLKNCGYALGFSQLVHKIS